MILVGSGGSALSSASVDAFADAKGNFVELSVDQFVDVKLTGRLE